VRPAHRAARRPPRARCQPGRVDSRVRWQMREGRLPRYRNTVRRHVQHTHHQRALAEQKRPRRQLQSKVLSPKHGRLLNHGFGETIGRSRRGWCPDLSAANCRPCRYNACTRRKSVRDGGHIDNMWSSVQFRICPDIRFSRERPGRIVR
jgi:hypothetical protein